MSLPTQVVRHSVPELLKINTSTAGEMFELKKQANKVFLCDICGTSINTQKNFTRHLQEQHGTGVTYDCTGCNFSTKRLENLRVHLKSEKHGKVVKRLREIEIQTAPFQFKRQKPNEKEAPKKQNEEQKTPKEPEPMTSRKYFQEPVSTESYIYQQTLKKNKTPPIWIMNQLDTPIKNVWQQKKKGPTKIPLHSIQKQIDPRVSASTSTLSLYSNVSELSQMAEQLEEIINGQNHQNQKAREEDTEKEEDIEEEQQEKEQEEPKKEQNNPGQQEILQESPTSPQHSPTSPLQDPTPSLIPLPVLLPSPEPETLGDLMQFADIPLDWDPTDFLGEVFDLP